MSNTKNYSTDGGDRLYIGGVLEFGPDSNIVGLDNVFTPGEPVNLEPVANSEATTVAQLREDFNNLLAVLRKNYALAGDEK